MRIEYKVISVDETGTIFPRTYSFDDKEYPHSSHLVKIMQYLDDEGLEMSIIEAVS